MTDLPPGFEVVLTNHRPTHPTTRYVKHHGADQSKHDQPVPRHPHR